VQHQRRYRAIDTPTHGHQYFSFFAHVAANIQRRKAAATWRIFYKE